MEEEKMEKNYLSLAIYAPRWRRSLSRRGAAGGAGQRGGAGVLPVPHRPAALPGRARGWSTRCGLVNWWCWSSTMRRLPLPFPRFLQPAVLLLFLLICSIRRVRVLRVPSLPLCRCALCAFTLYPILLCVLPRTFEVPISGVPAKFWSQHLFLTLSRRSSFGAFKDVAFLILCFSETQVTWSTDTILKVLI